MLALLRETVIITIAGIGGGAIAVVLGFGLETLAAWL